jgi:hypothetical protein
MEEIFYLDLHKNQLFGFQPWAQEKHIEDILEGISLGGNFPAVPVYRTLDGKFYLALDKRREDKPSVVDGGHHRAIAHYQARKPLKCKRLEGEPPSAPGHYIPIRDITLV